MRGCTCAWVENPLQQPRRACSCCHMTSGWCRHMQIKLLTARSLCPPLRLPCFAAGKALGFSPLMPPDFPGMDIANIVCQAEGMPLPLLKSFASYRGDGKVA